MASVNLKNIFELCKRERLFYLKKKIATLVAQHSSVDNLRELEGLLNVTPFTLVWWKGTTILELYFGQEQFRE